MPIVILFILPALTIKALDFTVVPSYFGVLAMGALWTIAITVCAGLLSFFGGIVFAVTALYGHWSIRLPVPAFACLFIRALDAIAAAGSLTMVVAAIFGIARRRNRLRSRR